MAIVETLPPSVDGHRRLGLASPATGEPVGEITVSTPAEVDAAIARARAAQPAWAARPAAERAAVIARALDVLLARKDENRQPPRRGRQGQGRDHPRRRRGRHR
jgi:acyl-CoA reductase-like NAD-dependent aldehyde dehydrogenase